MRMRIWMRRRFRRWMSRFRRRRRFRRWMRRGRRGGSGGVKVI